MRALALLAPALALTLAQPARAANPVVRFATDVGSFDVEMCETVSAVCEHAAPFTVANFLGYVDDGAYAQSVVHRSVAGFVIQGGSFRLQNGPLITAISTGATVDNEFDGFPNRRGTLSVPLLGDPNATTACDTQEDSGTSGWFINLADNSASLDCGLFTVFAVVLGDGMLVVDALAALPRLQFFDPITQTAPQFLFPLFDPVSLITAFTTVPVTQELFDLATSQTQPTLAQVAEGLIVATDVTRVPEPATGAAGAAAALALAALARRRTAP